MGSQRVGHNWVTFTFTFHWSPTLLICLSWFLPSCLYLFSFFFFFLIRLWDSQVPSFLFGALPLLSDFPLPTRDRLPSLERISEGSMCSMGNSFSVHAKLLQSCLTLCDPMDSSLPGFSVHGDSAGKNIEVAMPSSRISSWLRDRTPHILHLPH